MKDEEDEGRISIVGSVYCLWLGVLGNLINRKVWRRREQSLNSSEGDDGKVSVVGVGIDIDLLDLLSGKGEERSLSRNGSMRDGTSLHSIELKQFAIDLSETDKVVVHLSLLNLGLSLLNSFVVDLTDLSVLFSCVLDQVLVLGLEKRKKEK